jgi:hypothetical protein
MVRSTAPPCVSNHEATAVAYFGCSFSAAELMQ